MFMRKTAKVLLLVASLVMSVASYAGTEINGIFYELDSKTKEASVVTNEPEAFFSSYSGNVVIPESVSYAGDVYKVTSIARYAFYGAIEVTGVTIPSTVEYVDEFAFSQCSGLESIVVDEKNQVYDSRGNCNALIHTARNELVKGCKNTIIPNTVKKIGNYAFEFVGDLKSIVIPSSVTVIGKQAFYYSGLVSVSISPGLKEIGMNAFYRCTSLSSINLPEGLTTVGNFAFYECSRLSSIVLPSSLTTIDECAFELCSSLKTVTNLSTTPQVIYNRTFTVWGDLIVPEGSEEAYMNAPIWKHFATIKGQPLSSGVASLRGSDGDLPTVVYDLSGKRLTAPQRGLNIVNGKKRVR